MTDSHMLLLADLVLFVHFFLAGYIVLGLPAIWLGRLLGWRLIHNLWFRYSHGGFMGIVLLESLVGVFCPLTAWEGALRQAAGDGGADQGKSFMAYWMGKLLFYDMNETVFTFVYAVYFVAVVITFWCIPVRESRKNLPHHSPD